MCLLVFLSINKFMFYTFNACLCTLGSVKHSSRATGTVNISEIWYDLLAVCKGKATLGPEPTEHSKPTSQARVVTLKLLATELFFF